MKIDWLLGKLDFVVFLLEKSQRERFAKKEQFTHITKRLFQSNYYNFYRSWSDVEQEKNFQKKDDSIITVYRKLSFAEVLSTIMFKNQIMLNCRWIV